MGHIINILREETVGKEIDNEARLEIEECIHLHINDLRIIMTKENFLAISDLFSAARKKYDEMGQPESLPTMQSLGGTKIGKLLSHNRFGIEHQIDNTFHIHHKNLRIHLNSGDFLGIMNLCGDARQNIPESFVREVLVSECSYHDIVNHYIALLNDYDKGMYPREDPGSIITLRNEMIRAWSNTGDWSKRVLGFPDVIHGPISDELDRRYLFTVYESIRQYGYASGPMARRYIWAYMRFDKVHITGSHRMAVIKKLDYRTIKVFLMSQPSDQL